MTSKHNSTAPAPRRGPRTRGADHADKVRASPEAIQRLRAILQSLTGNLTVTEAADQLSMKESRFHVIRDKALQGAAEALERRKPGPKVEEGNTAKDAIVKNLEEEVDRLRLELQGANIRIGFALTEPHLLIDDPDNTDAQQPEKKTTPKKTQGPEKGKRRLRPKKH